MSYSTFLSMQKSLYAIIQNLTPDFNILMYSNLWGMLGGVSFFVIGFSLCWWFMRSTIKKDPSSGLPVGIFCLSTGVISGVIGYISIVIGLYLKIRN